MEKRRINRYLTNLFAGLYSIILIGLTLSSCTSNQNQIEDSKIDSINTNRSLYRTYKEGELINFTKAPTSDTVALGFVLGESKIHALQNLQRLTDEKKIIKYTPDVKSQLEKQGFKDIPDYVYRMITDDTVDVELSLDLGFDNGKLSALFLTSYGSPTGSFNKDFTNVLNFMVRKFGNSQLVTKDSTSGVETHYWFDGYKEISIYNVTRYTFYYRLTYSDLRVQVAKKNQRQLSDSLYILNEAEKRNKEKEDQKDDIR